MWCQQNTVVVEKLNRPPFSIRVTQHELEVKLGPEALLKILNDVLSEIDPTMATDGDSTAKTLGLLKVLQLGVPRGAAKDLEAKLRAGDKATVFALLHWALARLGSHKKRVYDARFELSIEALAAASAPAPEHNALWAHFAQLEANLRRFDNASPANASPAANAPPSPVPPLPTPSRSPLKSSRVSPPPPPYAAARGAALFRSMDASADVSVASSDGTYADELAAERPWRRSEAKVPESVVMNHLEDDLDDTDDEAAAVHPIFDKVLEVGIPAAWDLHRLLQLAAVDSVETSANPRRTLAQRWKASLKSVASKVTSTLRKKESARAAAQAKDDADLCSECLHATEPGAVNPQLVWSYPRGGSDALALEVRLPGLDRLSHIDRSRHFASPRARSSSKPKTRLPLFLICPCPKRRRRLKRPKARWHPAPAPARTSSTASAGSRRARGASGTPLSTYPRAIASSRDGPFSSSISTSCAVRSSWPKRRRRR